MFLIYAGQGTSVSLCIINHSLMTSTVYLWSCMRLHSKSSASVLRVGRSQNIFFSNIFRYIIFLSAALLSMCNLLPIELFTLIDCCSLPCVFWKWNKLIGKCTFYPLGRSSVFSGFTINSLCNCTYESRCSSDFSNLIFSLCLFARKEWKSPSIKVRFAVPVFFLEQNLLVLQPRTLSLMVDLIALQVSFSFFLCNQKSIEPIRLRMVFFEPSRKSCFFSKYFSMSRVYLKGLLSFFPDIISVPFITFIDSHNSSFMVLSLALTTLEILEDLASSCNLADKYAKLGCRSALVFDRISLRSDITILACRLRSGTPLFVGSFLRQTILKCFCPCILFILIFITT